jgi:nitroimidazol reductase NimA-like FMN-containing flavoprotein (pyridoxamine 5'-phosphate oxidase superfamily)
MIVQPLNTEECRAALASARFGRLGCARENQPYVVPIYFAVDETYIYSFALAGQKLA